eukprot:m.85898 g.85898  ORF g.85898 m.85898 type:complete len:448 (+) comp15073_c2_seq5:1854-3197(+)
MRWTTYLSNTYCFRRSTMSSEELRSFEALCEHPIADIVLFMEAQNSSGDVYHVLYFLLLLRHLKWGLPARVLIFHDAVASENWALCSKALLGFFGFGKLVECVKLSEADVEGGAGESSDEGSKASSSASGKSKCYRQSTRLKNAIVNIMNTKPGKYAVNHKLVTCWIVRMLQLAPKLRDDISIWSLTDGFLETHNIGERSLSDTVMADVADIKQHLKKRKLESLILINHRTSDAANKQHNGNDLNFHRLPNEKNYWYLFCIHITDATFNRSIHFKENGTIIFTKPPEWDAEVEALRKIRHITLLCELKKAMKDRLLLVGPTSGTTDIASFIGIKVLNFHVVELGKRLDENFARIVVQSELIRVVPVLSSDEDVVKQQLEKAHDIEKFESSGVLGKDDFPPKGKLDFKKFKGLCYLVEGDGRRRRSYSLLSCFRYLLESLAERDLFTE